MELYFSYNKKNDKEGAYIKRVIRPTLEKFHCTAWSMQDLIPGHLWKIDMEEHLQHAFLFVPIVSSEFLASDRCVEETQEAMKLSIEIVPILLDTCLVEYSLLANFDFLPKGGSPIKQWKRQNEAWDSVQRDLVKIIQERQNG